MRPIIWSHRSVHSVCLCVVCLSYLYQGHAVAADPNLITGTVQSQDLRRVDQAIVQVRDQEGNVVTQGVTNQAGELTVTVLEEGTYSVSAVQDTYKSEFVVVKVGMERAAPVALTMSVTQDIALEIVSPLPAIQYKASSETYQLSRKDIETLPKGNNNDVYEVLLTVPSVAYGSLKADTHPSRSCQSAVSDRWHSHSRHGQRGVCRYRSPPGLGAGRHHLGRDGSAVWE